MPSRRFLVIYHDHNDTVYITIHCDHVKSLNKYLVGFYNNEGILKKAIPSKGIKSIELLEDNNNE